MVVSRGHPYADTAIAVHTFCLGKQTRVKMDPAGVRPIPAMQTDTARLIFAGLGQPLEFAKGCCYPGAYGLVFLSDQSHAQLPDLEAHMPRTSHQLAAFENLRFLGPTGSFQAYCLDELQMNRQQAVSESWIGPAPWSGSSWPWSHQAVCNQQMTLLQATSGN